MRNYVFYVNTRNQAMDVFKTPIRTRTARKSKNVVTPVRIPQTPQMIKIGYGTGVNVYSMVRSPRNGTDRSPWAVKKVSRRFAESDYEKRLQDEASILQQLNHPNIVGFRAFVKNQDGVTCLAMEECHISLGDLLLERVPPLPAQIILKVCFDIAKALNYLHNEKFLLHGDLKSYNILIKGNFEAAKLCDFGVSQPLNRRGFSVNRNYIGTPLWTAPEALPLGDGQITHKADMFSFGLVIYEMITSRPPHTSTDASSETIDVDSSDEQSEEDELFNKELGTRPDLPPLSKEYDTVIHLYKWCTEVELDKRASANEVVKYLEDLMTEN